VIGGKFALADPFGANDGIDGDFVERVEQLRQARHRRRWPLAHFPGTEVLFDILCMRKTDSGTVYGHEPKSVPCFHGETIFKESNEASVKFDESLIFEFHAGLCQGRFCDNPLWRIGAAEDREKPIQLALV
jgi:hypothetical protein